MKIHLLGDSIVQSGQESKFYSGWGDYLSAFLKSSVEVRREKNFRGLDTVHSNRYGAFLHAAMIVGLLHEQKLLKDWELEVPSRYEQMPEHLMPRKAELERMWISPDWSKMAGLS